MVFGLGEIIDMAIMSLAIGFIFKDLFIRNQQTHRKQKEYDPLKALQQPRREAWKDILYAAAIIAPAIILHEFGHKFVAMAFGATATFEAAYGFLFLGVILKLLKFPFLFFIPAYVSYTTAGITPLMQSAIAFAGPFVNLLLWLIPLWLLKVRGSLGKYQLPILASAKINMFLFWFNMLPIPPIDGFHVVMGLIRTFF